MPYLNLGKTKVTYDNYEDRFIVTMILDTSCSYQYPVLVRDSSTLDIYFGKNFKYREFLEEMIFMGVTLYLYRPISLLETNKSLEDGIKELEDQGVPRDSIPEDYSLMPSQFIIPENSPSWKNRDTIRLFNRKQHNGFGFDYCYPEYGKSYSYFRSDGSRYLLGLGGAETSIDNKKLDSNIETLAFKLDFSKTTINDFLPYSNGSCKYIVIPYLGYNYMIWFMGKNSNAPEIVDIKSSMYIPLYNSSTKSLRSKEDVLDDLIKILKSDFSTNEPFGLGFDIINPSYDNSIFTISKRRTEEYLGTDEFKVNLQIPEKNYQYYDLPNFKMDSDFRRTNDILSEATEDIKQLEFYSKTIGKGEDDIKIKITKLINEQYEYSITISRFDYQEYYEVNLSDSYKYNYEPLSGVINKNSKLVSCKLFDRITSLPEGEFYLKGSYTEDYTFEERRQALDIIKECEINDDVLIIDDLELWKSDSNITGEDLKIFLDYSTYKDNQTFITNRSYRNIDPTTGGYNVYHEYKYNITDEDRWVRNLLTVRNDLFCNIDVILNVGDEEMLISDKQNRLIYFYNDMTFLKSYRPGCYVFLKGLLNDNYSVESTDIIYEVPEKYIMEELPEYKSNYMLFNNQYYYYPRYQNGGLSKVTTVTRFIISKIGREFRKGKWNIINMPTYEMHNYINNLIRKLKSSYSIISNLEMTSLSQSGNSLVIKLESKINELIVKDISINITLNYN